MKREHVIGLAAIAVIALAWALTTDGLGAKVKAQLDLSAGAGDGQGPVQVSLGSDPPLNTGIVPGKYQPHMPRYAHLGRHRMYHHPASCSPNMATLQLRSDWMFDPPSEGDL